MPHACLTQLRSEVSRLSTVFGAPAATIRKWPSSITWHLSKSEVLPLLALQFSPGHYVGSALEMVWKCLDLCPMTDHYKLVCTNKNAAQ